MADAAIAVEVNAPKVPGKLVDRSLQRRLVVIIRPIRQPALVEGSVCDTVGKRFDAT